MILSKAVLTLCVFGAVVMIAVSASNNMEEEEEGYELDTLSREKRAFIVEHTTLADVGNTTLTDSLKPTDDEITAQYNEYQRQQQNNGAEPEDDETSAESRSSTSSKFMNLNYYSCTSLNNKKGYCRPYVFCKAFHKRFYRTRATVKKYACGIPTTPAGFGLCCPDPAPLPESTVQDETGTVADIECGKGRSQTRIVGGTAALVGEFPWMASFMDYGGYPLNYCGGALISPSHIISAAHCFDDHDEAYIVSKSWVRLGEYDYSKNDDTPHVDRRLAKVLRHPKHNSKTFANDLAIVTLETPVRYNGYIRPICLPPPSTLEEGGEGVWAEKSATVAGWGRMSYKGKYSTILQKLTIPVWRNSQCKRVYRWRFLPMFICAGVKEAGKDACQNDSGGPLIVKDSGKYTLIGVVSWGIKCALANKPGVYTSVDKYMDWIQDNTSA